MNTSSLDQKTVRPNNLANYSYYHSGRHSQPVVGVEPKPKNHKSHRTILYMFGLLAIVLTPLMFSLSTNSATGSLTTPKPKTIAPAVAVIPNHCQNNTLAEDIIVSISARHLWACAENKQVYDSPVVTGMSAHPDTITPTGNYAIFSKITDTTLTGTDSTGSWNDPVSYWLPFLTNQYGTYGLHDATWRPNSAFGNISPSSSDASHGCVELPLATASWIYNWASVGTNVDITT